LTDPDPVFDRLPVAGKLRTLGWLKGKEYLGELRLSAEGGIVLAIGDQRIPLASVLMLSRGRLKLDKEVLIRLVDGDMLQPTAGVGVGSGA